MVKLNRLTGRTYYKTSCFVKQPIIKLLILIGGSVLLTAHAPVTSLTGFGQPPGSLAATDTRRYAIEVAGVRVGTMTASRQSQAGDRMLYTLISDVRVNFLVYKLVIFYKVDNLFQHGQLVRSVVNARTNRGNYLTQTEWKTTHYEIAADQYKYSRRTTEPNRIDFAVTNLYFDEPGSRRQAFAEYFGDYFSLTPTTAGTYRATLANREDEYVYKDGQLVRIVKKNPLKNFIIRLIP